SLLIKNAIGVFGMATLLILLAFPLLKIFALVVIYRVATVLVEPISDARLVDALGTMAHTLMLVMAAVATAALMFFIVITVVVGIGNLAAVVRSEEHTSELQSRENLVCRLLLEKKKETRE